MQASAVATALYTIQTMPPTVNFPNGFASAVGLSLKGSALVSSNVLQLTAAPNTYVKGAAWYTTPVNVGSFTTDFDFQLLSAKADGFTFAIQSAGLSAIGPAGSGLGYGASQPGGAGGIAHSVALKFDLYSNDGEGTDSTGVYVNGASPTAPATDMTASGVKLNSGHVLHAHIVYDGAKLTLTLTDAVTSASFTNAFAVNIPGALGSSNGYVVFTGATGRLSMTANILDWTLTGGGVQTAMIAPAIEKAARPGVSRPRPGSSSNMAAAAPIDEADAAQAPESTRSTNTADVAQSAATGTLGNGGGAKQFPMVAEQLMRATAESDSVVGEPAFFPKPGTFDGDTQVTLRRDTPGAVIRYTFDGSQPLADSPVYTGPIQVKGTALTIKAFASAPGKKDSAVVTGTYRIRE